MFRLSLLEIISHVLKLIRLVDNRGGVRKNRKEMIDEKRIEMTED